MARMARGRIVAALQDDDIGPERCEWVPRIHAQYEARPRTVVVGINRGVVISLCCNWEQYLDSFARDPVAETLVNFDLMVDVGPMTALRRHWVGTGGFDEGWGPIGSTGIFSDWAFTLQAWAAGQRVSRLLKRGLVSPADTASLRMHWTRR